MTGSVYGPNNTPIYQITTSGDVMYYHQDHLGSTRLTTNANGTTRGTLTYDAYGEIKTNTNPWFLEQPLLTYTGEFGDSETGFYYLRARYYDFATAQFTNQDPIVAVTGAPYAYASNDPANLIDPLGLLSWDDVKSTAGDAWDASGGQAVTWVKKNPDTLVTLGAIGFCLVPAVGTVGCGIATAAAFAARSGVQIHENGLSNAWRPVVADGIMTVATLGMGATLSGVAGPSAGNAWGQGALPGSKGLEYTGRLIMAGWEFPTFYNLFHEDC